MSDWLGRLDVAQNAALSRPFRSCSLQPAARMFNANQIFVIPPGDAATRRRPAGQSGDLANLDATMALGSRWNRTALRIVVRCRPMADAARQLALPHGFGQAYPAADGARPDERPADQPTDGQQSPDPIAGTPYHKNVPAFGQATPEEAIGLRFHE